MIGTSGNRGAVLVRAWRAIAAAACMLAAAATFAQGANSIEQVTVSKGSSGNTIVRFTLKAPPANPPAGFSIASPPRIALDFLDTGNGLGTTQKAVDEAGLRSLPRRHATSRSRPPRRRASRSITCR